MDVAPLTGSLTSPSVCPACRESLSTNEARFIRRVLRPSAFGWSARPAVSYDVWLPRFIASLAWRILGGVTDDGTNVVAELRRDVLDAREAWRGFAAGQATSPGRFELHMLPIVSLADTWRQDVYAHRAGQMQLLASRSGDGFVWMKLPGVLCLGMLAGTLALDSPLCGQPAVWRDAAHHVPGLIRFVMFEELQRSLRVCHDPGVLPAGYGGRSHHAGGA